MKKFKRIYIEITNICNLNCSFCPKTSRQKKIMSLKEFEHILMQIKPLTNTICLHLMGEPLLHPQIAEILKLCKINNIDVNLTTNGTLLKQNDNLLAQGLCKKISISLHSFEANSLNVELNEYLQNVFTTCNKISSSCNTIVEYRLWNNTSTAKNALNKIIVEQINKFYKTNVQIVPNVNNYTIQDKVFLGLDAVFDWPIQSQFSISSEKKFCFGLRTHFGILCDGTVVPCCLDSDGQINLGNIFETQIDKILSCNKATAIYNGFTNRKIAEKLCKTCTYAKRFDK